MTTALMTLKQSLEQETKWLANREKLLSEAGRVASVTSDSDLEVSSAIQTRISKHVKSLEVHRKGITKPLDDMKKQIMDQEKDLLKLLDAELRRLKAMNDAYATRRLEEQEAAHKAAEEKISHETINAQQQAESIFGAGVQFDAAFIPPAPSVVKPTTIAGRTVIRWEFEVISPNDIPREFLSVDDAKIRKFRDYQIEIGKDPEIPGVKFTKKVSVESR